MGEARGLRPRQILYDKKALIVDGFVKPNGFRTNYNKKGAEEHPKFRIVPLPDITLNLLKEHIAAKEITGDDFIFKGKKEPDKPVSAFYVHDNLEKLMEKAGIEINGMTEYYNKRVIDESLADISGADTAVQNS
jgi:integrase